MKTIAPRLLTACVCTVWLTLSATLVQAAAPANGTYQLRNRASGKMLDNLGSTADGANVAQWEASSSNNQRWNLSTTGSFWKLQCVTGGKFLDSIGRTGNDTPVGQWTGSSSINQQWTLQDLGNGYYKIINRANGLCLDTGGATANGSVVEFWGSGTSNNQQWQFVGAGGGGGGVTFYDQRNWAGASSQVFPVGSYTTAQMAARGAPNNWIDSFNWTFPGWGSHSVLLYDADNFSGTPRVYSLRAKVTPSNTTSSVRIQTGVPSGWTYAAAGSGLEEFQAGFIFGDWIQMHNGDMVELQSSGSSSYIVRYETEYWVGSGTISPPIVQVLSGTNTLASTTGTSDKGTCSGTAFPQEARYNLNGRVRWTNNESAGGCAYNLTFRDGHH